jgi:gamma-glutamylcyclotransferase (GGCT)/AIG2-like uncharacterized protein YtfP
VITPPSGSGRRGLATPSSHAARALLDGLLKALRPEDLNEEVSAAVVPLLQLLFDVIIERPSQKLAVYGTLAPGERNHRIIKNIPGRWRDCKLHGVINWIGGLPALSWDPSASEVNAKLFESEELTNHWERLDRFEGPGYKRWIVPVETDSGIVIANVYVASGLMG